MSLAPVPALDARADVGREGRSRLAPKITSDDLPCPADLRDAKSVPDFLRSRLISDCLHALIIVPTPGSDHPPFGGSLRSRDDGLLPYLASSSDDERDDEDPDEADDRPYEDGSDERGTRDGRIADDEEDDERDESEHSDSLR